MRAIACGVLLAFSLGCVSQPKGVTPPIALPTEEQRETALWSAQESVYADILMHYCTNGAPMQAAQDLRKLYYAYTNSLPNQNEYLLELAADLEHLAREDEQSKARGAGGPVAYEFTGRPVRELMEYYIYHLRNFSHHPYTATYYSTLLFDKSFIEINSDRELGVFPQDRMNPAKALRVLGRRDIPRLIEMLADRRPTRCVAHWRDYKPGTWFLLRNQDIAIAILDSYRGVSFYDPSMSGIYFSRELPELQSAVTDSVKEWYLEGPGAGPDERR